MTPIVLHMSVPPSANSIWRSVNGRVIKSKRYREWMQERPWFEKMPPAEDGTGWVVRLLSADLAVDILMKRPRKNSDLDNRLKPLLDKLTTYGWIKDDKQVVDVRARWADVDGCVVTITPLEAA